MHWAATLCFGAASRLNAVELLAIGNLDLVLVDEHNKPAGGKWSFDTENRKKLPRTVNPPRVSPAAGTQRVSEAKDLVKKHFAGHPGSVAEFWWPTTRQQALEWLAEFVDQQHQR